MVKKEVTLTFVFDEQEEDGYTYVDLTEIKQDSTEIDAETMYGFLEDLAQSDYGYTEFPNHVMTALEGITVNTDER